MWTGLAFHLGQDAEAGLVTLSIVAVCGSLLIPYLRAKAEAAPAVKVSVRELPSPTAPARDVAAVAPLVESATDRNGQLGIVPPAFKKAVMPAAKSLLDTGSLVSLPGRLPLPRNPVAGPLNDQASTSQARERKAG